MWKYLDFHLTSIGQNSYECVGLHTSPETPRLNLESPHNCLWLLSKIHYFIGLCPNAKMAANSFAFGHMPDCLSWLRTVSPSASSWKISIIHDECVTQQIALRNKWVTFQVLTTTYGMFLLNANFRRLWSNTGPLLSPKFNEATSETTSFFYLLNLTRRSADFSAFFSRVEFRHSSFLKNLPWMTKNKQPRYHMYHGLLMSPWDLPKVSNQIGTVLYIPHL